MNVHLLIDAIVRQTTVLVAQLATTGGARASLSHTANQVFLDLTAELKQQGLGNKLIADMFGLSLRTYHNKIRRLAESSTERGRPLWNAVLDFVQSQKLVSRREVLVRFCRDDEGTVKSVLSDLVDNGLVFSKGAGDQVAYRAASPAEYEQADPQREAEARANLVWISIARHSPIRRSQLGELLQVDGASLDEALRVLVADERVTEHDPGPDPEYTSGSCIIPMGESAGWEASVFDHYQAMVTAICTKLRRGESRAQLGDWVGGSTYGFDVWADHPLHDEVVGFLSSMRERATDLRRRVDLYNESASAPDGGKRRVIAYVGQTVVDELREDEK
jgi:hypothetical protein